MAEFAALWPIKRFPVLVDGSRTVVEASIIIEYLGLYHPGPVPLLPADAARRARSAQHGPLLRQLHLDAAAKDRLRQPAPRGGARPARASPTPARCSTPRTAGWTSVMAEREWAAGDTFSLADCGAAPFLFYADWTHPIDAGLRARARLSPAAAGAAVVCARGRRSAAVSPAVSRSARPTAIEGGSGSRATAALSTKVPGARLSPNRQDNNISTLYTSLRNPLPPITHKAKHGPFRSDGDIYACGRGEQLHQSIRVARPAPRQSQPHDPGAGGTRRRAAAEPFDAPGQRHRRRRAVLRTLRAHPRRSRRRRIVAVEQARKSGRHDPRRYVRHAGPRAAAARARRFLPAIPRDRRAARSRGPQHRSDSGRRGLRDPHGHAGRVESRRAADRPGADRHVRVARVSGEIRHADHARRTQRASRRQLRVRAHRQDLPVRIPGGRRDRQGRAEKRARGERRLGLHRRGRARPRHHPAVALHGRRTDRARRAQGNSHRTTRAPARHFRCSTRIAAI